MRLYQNSEARLELTIKYLKELRKIKNTKETDKQLEEKAKKFVNDNNRLTTHINAIEAQNTDKYYKELSEELGAEVERELGNSKIPGAYARIFHLYFKKENSPEDRKYNIDLYKKFMDPNFAAKKVTETVKEALELDKKLLYPKTVEEGVKTFTSNPTLFKKLFVLDSCLNELIVNPTLAKVLENNYSLFQTGAQIATMATLPANNLYITLPVEDNNDYMLLANNMEMSKIPADYLQYEGYIPSKSGGKFDESTIQYFSQHLLLGMNLDTNAKINKYLADLDKNVSFCTAKVNGTETTISKALEATTNKKNKVEFKEFSSKEMDNLMVILNGDPITPKKSVVVDTENDIINTNENIINTNTKENNISLDEDIIDTDPNDMHIRRVDNSKKGTSNRGMTEKSIITDDDAFAYEGDNIDFEESKVDNRISIDGENYNIGEVDNITVVSKGFTNKSSDPIYNEITYLIGEQSIVWVDNEVRNAELAKMERQGVIYDPNKTKKENFTNALKTIVNNGGSIGELKHCTRSLDDIGYVAIRLMDMYNLKFDNDFKMDDINKAALDLTSSKDVRESLKKKFFEDLQTEERYFALNKTSDVSEFDRIDATVTDKKEANRQKVQFIKNRGPVGIVDGEKHATDAISDYYRLKDYHSKHGILYKIFAVGAYIREANVLSQMRTVLSYKLSISERFFDKELKQYDTKFATNLDKLNAFSKNETAAKKMVIAADTRRINRILATANEIEKIDKNAAKEYKKSLLNIEESFESDKKTVYSDNGMENLYNDLKNDINNYEVKKESFSSDKSVKKPIKVIEEDKKSEYSDNGMENIYNELKEDYSKENIDNSFTSDAVEEDKKSEYSELTEDENNIVNTK